MKCGLCMVVAHMSYIYIYKEQSVKKKLIAMQAAVMKRYLKTWI